jgi:predicted membrane chloride channel (bestrophin family)
MQDCANLPTSKLSSFGARTAIRAPLAQLQYRCPRTRLGFLWAPMIHYNRTDWYGVSYFFRIRGSLFPRCLPAMILAGILSGLAASGTIEDVTGMNVDDFFGNDDYAMQLFGVVFGFLSVTRLNMSYSRYWEGITEIKQMHSKWADACLHIVAFDRIYDDAEGCGEDAFCQHVVRLFCQLSAMAIISLHDDEWAFNAGAEDEDLERFSAARIEKAEHVVVRLLHLPSDAKVFHRTSANLAKGLKKNDAKSAMSSEALAVGLREQRRAKLMTKRDDSAAKRRSRGSRSSLSTNFERRLIDEEEQRFLGSAPDPVLATVQRIVRAVSTRHQFGGVCAPSPIVSRVFQELSNGLLAYNAATKIKEVPVPFAYVQFNAMLFCLFVLFTPLAIAAFTGQVASSVLISMIVVGGFAAMWLVANELEDPFGDDANDLPMVGYHEHFVRALMRMHTRAWLPRDKWVTMEGTWVNPTEERDAESIAREQRRAATRRRSTCSTRRSCIEAAIKASGTAQSLSPQRAATALAGSLGAAIGSGEPADSSCAAAPEAAAPSSETTGNLPQPSNLPPPPNMRKPRMSVLQC